MVRALFIFICLAWRFEGVSSQTFSSNEPLEITIGHHHQMQFEKPIARVALGTPDIVQVSSVEGSELLLRGATLGATNLLIWVEGENTPRTFQAVVFPDTQHFEALLKSQSAFSKIKLEKHGQALVLTGDIASNEAHHNLRKIADDYLKAPYIDRVLVLQNLMVSVDVRFAIVSSRTLKSLGFDFSVFSRDFQTSVVGPSAVSGFNFSPDTGLSLDQGLPISDAFNVFFGLPNANFLSVLSALDGLQVATTLAQPTLVVRSGEVADFIAGGKIPVPVPQGNDAIGIQYEDFGISLVLEPTVLAKNRIVMKIAPEISELDFGNAVTIGGTSVPAISRRAASTTLELSSGQSFILAGLLSSSSSNAEDQLPFFGDLPILGAFFKRVRSAQQRQELVIVATPRLVRPITQDGHEISLPGDKIRDYDPSVLDMLLGENRLKDISAPYGLLP